MQTIGGGSNQDTASLDDKSELSGPAAIFYATSYFFMAVFIIGTVFVIIRRAGGVYSQVTVGTERALDDWIKTMLDKSKHATALQWRNGSNREMKAELKASSLHELRARGNGLGLAVEGVGRKPLMKMILLAEREKDVSRMKKLLDAILDFQKSTQSDLNKDWKRW